ncbi:hypothetical protein MGG_17749 [Pyricularia oryzae 70-15]|uniref:Uncharacterized protein n=3 Tax=Pyricularia oryzae TaxID=318829 RepID=G4NHK9_PYRO7|nr:uncharacterized protein MGG_17749 [Pyricularia oryzae 70-15]EHA47719.1 hypothetical protein MGG_17749 [Pyricularia oryzae 70-15]ELQ37776.1 hypothetical protein OOU_Y34scaffold00578g6 [Pyricularia oryzae Y34]
MDPWELCTVERVQGESRLTLAATATLEAPERRAWTAWWMATSDEAHAVSIVMLAPPVK